MRLAFLLLTLLAPCISLAAPQVQKLDPARSSVTFSVQSDFGPIGGRFNNYRGTLTIDRGDLESGKVNLEIDLSDVTLTQQPTQGLIGLEPLIRSVPQPAAQFTSTRIVELPPNKFLVSGIVTRSRNRDQVELPVIATVTEAKSEVRATFSQDRAPNTDPVWAMIPGLRKGQIQLTLVFVRTGAPRAVTPSARRGAGTKKVTDY